ncbi:MAG: BON domain-containing protein [Bacteriovoracaceae bacterium]
MRAANKNKDEERVYQYATGRGGIPITPEMKGHFGKGPKGYKKTDERIYEQVCDALYSSYDVDASNIDVEVKDGCVYLRGEVDSRQTKKLAEDAADSVAGVYDVKNELTFKQNLPIVGRSLS